MTPKEQAFLEDFAALIQRHGFPFTTTPLQVAPQAVVHMIGFENLVHSKNCIESILSGTKPGSYHLVLTNNGSRDGTKEYFDQIASQFPHVTIHHESENTGFQAPNEKAFTLARKLGAKWYCPVNNDVVLPAGWLEKLIEPLEANPKGAISGPFGGCSRVNDQMNGCDDTKLEFVEFSCACVRVEAVTTPTLFAPFLSFIYCEDLQISLDLQYRGWSIHRAPFRILHRGSQTAGAHPEAKQKCAEANARNMAEMRKRYAHWNKVRRFDHPILVKRKYAVGDVLLTTPIIRALAKKYPLCPIYVVTDYPSLFDGNPCVAEASTLGGFRKFSPDARDAMVIDLDGSYERTPGRHVIESYAEVAGIDPAEIIYQLEYFGTESPPRRGLSGKWAAMHIGPTAWGGKNWPVDRWNTVAQRLRKQGWKILLLGSPPKDAAVLADLDMRGQSGYPELASLLSQCALFLGVDSFPAHFATSLRVPAVVLYGITDPNCFAVLSSKYIAVTSDPAHPDTGRRNREANITYINTDDSVMRTISVESVMTAVEEILK